jgi:hypothetical protein
VVVSVSPYPDAGPSTVHSTRAMTSLPRMPLPDVLRSLLTATGPSGYETAPAAVFRDAASTFAETSVDVMGTSLARVPGTGDGRPWRWSATSTRSG